MSNDKKITYKVAFLYLKDPWGLVGDRGREWRSDRELILDNIIGLIKLCVKLF